VAATGSCTSSAADVFVPAHRVVISAEMLAEPPAGYVPPAPTGREYGLFSYIIAQGAAALVGIARGAHDLFLERLPGRGITYTSWTLEERATVRGHAAYAVELAKEATTALYEASGATAIQRAVPIQRFHRDLQGLALHGMILLQPSLEVYGRVLLGLDPDTPLL
jgi:hypothetical protein